MGFESSLRAGEESRRGIDMASWGKLPRREVVNLWPSGGAAQPQAEPISGACPRTIVVQCPEAGGPAHLQISPGLALNGGFSFNLRTFLNRTRTKAGLPSGSGSPIRSTSAWHATHGGQPAHRHR
jgi:hypothetical protein